MQPRIYLDNNATTPVDPRVIEVVSEALQSCYGNPSSAHALGREARQRLNEARRQIAAYLQVKPQEVIFTSGGTESVTTVLSGVVKQHPEGHIITSSVEHSCVYTSLRAREKAGQPVTFLAPGAHGAITSEQVKAVLQPNTVLIALMAVNNETGVKSDVEGIAEVAQRAGVPLFIDAVALLGKESFFIPKGISAMAFSGHKVHAPKGTGVLVLRSGFVLPPLLSGGGQEYGKRGGTENLPGILGLAAAIRLLESELPEATEKMRRLRDRLQTGILAALPDTRINGAGPRVANTLNVSFSGIDGESLLIALDQEGLAVSHGSACASGALEPSRILLEMGLPLEEARSAMRLSLSRMNTEIEIDRAIEIIVSQVRRLRKG